VRRFDSQARAGIAAVAAIIFAAVAMARAPRARPPQDSAPPERPAYEDDRDLQEQDDGKVAPPERQAVDGVEVVFQTGHSEGISSVAASADGRYILSGSWDDTVKLWDVASGRQLRTFTTDGASELRFVQGADRFIIKSSEHTSLFDLVTGRKLRDIGVTSSGHSISAISANGRFVATLGDTKISNLTFSMKTSLNIVDLSNDKVVGTQFFNGSVYPTAVSDDGKVVVVSGTQFKMAGQSVEMQTQVWDLAEKKLRFALPLDYAGGHFTELDLSPDGSLFAVLGAKKMQVSRTADGHRLFEVIRGSEDYWRSAVFSPDGSKLAAGNDIWEVPSGRKLMHVDGEAFAFGGDNRSLVVGPRNSGAPELYDLETGTATPVANSASSIIEIAVVGGGAYVATSSMHGGLRLWDLRTGQLVRSFSCPGGLGATSLDGDQQGLFLVGSCVGGARLWSLRSGELIRTLNPAADNDNSMPGPVRFDPAGKRIVLATREELLVFDAAEGRELRRMTLPRNASMVDMAGKFPVPGSEELSDEASAERLENLAASSELAHSTMALEFHPDGRRVAAVKDNGVLLVDIESGTVERRIARAAPDFAAMQKYLQDQVAAASAAQKKPSTTQRLLGGLLGVTPALPGRKNRDADVPTSEEMAAAFDAAANVIRQVVFSADGRRLYTLEAAGTGEWDVQSGNEIPGATKSPLQASVFTSGGLAIASGGIAAQGFGNQVRVWNLSTQQEVARLAGHTSDVTSVAYVPGERLLLSGSRDGTVIVWSVAERKQLAQLIGLGASDYFTVTPDSYYRTSRRGISGVAFRSEDRFYPFEQFDLRFNRPDIILERLGMTPPEVVRSYRMAYERRLKKMGLTEQMLGGQLQLPEVAFLGAKPPVKTDATSLVLRVRAQDRQFPLNRLNIFVNDVPVYGSTGLPVAEPTSRSFERDIDVPLIPGRNKLQVSVLNQKGVESLRQTVYTTSTAKPTPPDVYIVSVGVSRYQHSQYNLRFAAKDAADLANAYRGLAAGATPGHAAYGQVHVLDLSNEKATREDIRRAKEWLAQARVNDLVVVFAAGHGMTDARQDYFFGTYDIDPEHPNLRGLPYEDFEALLDGIPALKKVLLIDTCFSGEIEKDESTIVAQTQVSGAGTVSMRSFKAARAVNVVADENAPAAAAGGEITPADAMRFQQELFADLRRGTGAVVISSASGNEYALEGEQWSNGVFTYALLNGLRNARADANKDGTVTVSELQAFVIDEVRKLTAGGQNPTVRRENLEYDFAVY